MQGISSWRSRRDNRKNEGSQLTNGSRLQMPERGHGVDLLAPQQNILARAKERLRCYHDVAGEVESTGKCSWNIVPG
jgi:hypothetical protein